MTRFIKVKRTALFTIICFTSYIGLLSQVQMRLSSNQKQTEGREAPLLDLQPRLTTLGKGSMTSSPEAERISQDDFSLDRASVQGDASYIREKHLTAQGEPFVSTVNDYVSTKGQSTSVTAHTSQPRTVRFAPVGDMYVYSAYLDLRSKGNATIRIFALQREKDEDTLLCRITDEDQKELYTLYAQSYRMCESHGKEFGGRIYSCVIPTSLTALPRTVSVLPFTHNNNNRRQVQNSYETKLDLNVIPTRTTSAADKIGVCVPPLFGNLSLASIIHFIQMCKVLGADWIFMYVGSTVSPDIRRFLTHQSQKDAALSVTDWTLPANVSEWRQDKLWYHGQLLAINDCLYRNMAAFTFLLFIDLDEMLVPRSAYAWPQMLKEIFTAENRNRVAALSFKSAFFDPTKVPQYSEHIMYFQHLYRTVTLSTVRRKLLVQPLKVFEVGIHHLSKAMREEFGSVNVDEKVAILHHYRPCERTYEPDMKCLSTTEDSTMLRYKQTLTHLSHRVITDASRLFA